MTRHFFRLAAVTCAVAGGLSGASLAAAQENGNPLILPGEGIGEVRLEMEDPKVREHLGEPNTTVDEAGAYWAAWFVKKEGGGRGAELDIKSNHSLDHEKNAATVTIRVESPFFHTNEGISTKSSLADIWKAFPNLRYAQNGSRDKAVEIYADDTRGIAIEVRRSRADSGAWGTCQAIVVFAAHSFPIGGAPNIFSMRDLPDK